MLPLSHHPLVDCTTRWSLSLLFGFLCWSPVVIPTHPDIKRQSRSEICKPSPLPPKMPLAMVSRAIIRPMKCWHQWSHKTGATNGTTLWPFQHKSPTNNPPSNGLVAPSYYSSTSLSPPSAPTLLPVWWRPQLSSQAWVEINCFQPTHSESCSALSTVWTMPVQWKGGPHLID